jgi:multidrug resistance efflux pump
LPLGQRLLRAGLISQSQLAQALREQQQNHLKLGEVCLEHGWLTPAALYRFLPSQSLSLGEILVALGHLDFEQLRVALAQQRRYGRKLGEILTWKGWVQPAILDRALDVQVQLQRMASPNAWEALQPFLAKDPKPEVQLTPRRSTIPGREDLAQDWPAPEEARRESTVQPPSLESAAGGDPIPGTLAAAASDPFADEPQPATLADYRKQVEALQLQIELQEQEWDRILASMNQQIADFQSQYQQRIQKLEATIRLQQAELQHQATLQQDLRVWREQLQRLETELALARAAEQRAQRQLQTQRDCYQSELEQLQEQIQILQKRQLDSVPSSVVADLRAQLEAALHQIQQLRSERDQLQAQLAQQAAEPEAAPSRHLDSFWPEQVAALEQQIAELRAALQMWQERYAQLQQEHEAQMARLSGYVPPEQVESLQVQLQQLQAEIAQLMAANRDYEAHLAQLEGQLQQSQALIHQLRAERAEADQRIVQLEGSLQARQEALEQAQQQLKTTGSRLSALQQQQANLTVELRDARELLAAYRQSLETLQENLKIEQNRNRLLQVSYEQQKLIAEAAQAQLRAANFSGSTAKDEPARSRERNTVLTRRLEEPATDAGELPANPEDTPTDPLLAELTPWARHLFQNLQAAGLLDRPQIQDILSRWQQSGGKLTAVIGECTGLKATTVALAVRFPVGCRRHSTFKFFADGGYSARLSGCRTVGEFLKAADLLAAEVLESLPPMDESSPHWGDPLVERGLLRPETLQYFRKHFLPASASGC